MFYNTFYVFFSNKFLFSMMLKVKVSDIYILPLIGKPKQQWSVGR